MNRWVIAVACGVINFLIIGGARLTPLLYVASMERYHINRQNASFPYVLCFLLRMLLGPVFGYVGRKLGLRGATLCGCIVSFVGMGGCFFAENITAVTVIWGIFYGIGLGLSTALLPAILYQHFETEGTLANGVALAGSSLGALILPFILDNLLDTYGLCGSQLIISAICLNSVPAALLLKISHLRSEKNPNNPPTESSCPNGKPNTCLKEDIKFINGSEASRLTTQLTHDVTKGHRNPAFSLNDENSNLSNTCKVIPLSTNPVTIDQKTTFLHDFFLKRGQILDVSNYNTSEIRKVSGEPVLLNIYNLQRNVNNTSSFQNTFSIEEGAHTAKPTSSKFRSLRLFCDPTFIVIMVTQSLYTFIICMAWTIILDYITDKGTSGENGVYFVMFLPAADVVGRLSLAWVTDKGFMSQVNFVCLGFICMAIGALLLVWSSGFAFILIAEFIFAFCSGALMVQFPGVVNEFIDSENKTMAMASRQILHAPLSLLVSPLIGYFRGTLGSYDGILYLSSAICFCCGGMMLLIPFLVKRAVGKL